MPGGRPEDEHQGFPRENPYRGAVGGPDARYLFGRNIPRFINPLDDLLARGYRPAPLLDSTPFNQLIVGKPATDKKKRTEKRRRDRTRGRKSDAAIFADPQAAHREKAKAARTRDTGVPRGTPGIRGPVTGSIFGSLVLGEMQGWVGRGIDRSLARRELGGNFPNDPGPRGRARVGQGGKRTNRRGALANRAASGGNAAPPVDRPPKAPEKKPDAPLPASLPRPGGVGDTRVPDLEPAPTRQPTPTVQRPGGIAYPSQSRQASRFLTGAVPGTDVRVVPRARPAPLRATNVPRAQARAAASPGLTLINSLGVPSVPTNSQDRCECPKRKPRKKSCTNPVLSREIKGNVLTIRRSLQCPPSNSKAR